MKNKKISLLEHYLKDERTEFFNWKSHAYGGCYNLPHPSELPGKYVLPWATNTYLTNQLYRREGELYHETVLSVLEDRKDGEMKETRVSQVQTHKGLIDKEYLIEIFEDSYKEFWLSPQSEKIEKFLMIQFASRILKDQKIQSKFVSFDGTVKDKFDSLWRFKTNPKTYQETKELKEINKIFKVKEWVEGH